MVTPCLKWKFTMVLDTLFPGAGLHIRCLKEVLIETLHNDEGSHTEQWEMVIDDSYFTDGYGNEVRELPPEVQALFLSWDLDTREQHSASHILMSFVGPEHAYLFAHMALVQLLNFQLPTDSKLQWRSLINEPNIVVKGIDDFATAVKGCGYTSSENYLAPKATNYACVLERINIRHRRVSE